MLFQIMGHAHTFFNKNGDKTEKTRIYLAVSIILRIFAAMERKGSVME